MRDTLRGSKNERKKEEEEEEGDNVNQKESGQRRRGVRCVAVAEEGFNGGKCVQLFQVR